MWIRVPVFVYVAVTVERNLLQECESSVEKFKN